MLNYNKSNIFEGLSDNDIKRILNMCDFNTLKYKKGEVIKKQGQECNYVYLLLEGKVSLETTYRDNRKEILATRETYNLLGDVLLFSDNNIYPADLNVVENTRLITLDEFNFYTLLCDYRVLRNYIKYCSNRIYELTQRMKVYKINDTSKRVSAFLSIEDFKNIKVEYSDRELKEKFNLTNSDILKYN